jgi:hypothetical protein
MLPAFGVAGVTLLLAVPLMWWMLARFIPASRGTLEQVVHEVVGNPSGD